MEKIVVEKDKGFLSSLVDMLFVGVAVHYIFWVFQACFVWCILYWYFGNPLLYVTIPLVLAYLPSFLDGAHIKNGRPWPALRMSSWWACAHRHSGIEVVKTAELPTDKGQKYIISMSPHGILILSRVTIYGGIWEKLFPNVDFRVLGATPMFYVPFCREFCLWLGAIDASRKSAEKALKSGLSLMVYPGGSKEIFHTRPGSDEITIVLNERLGFVKLAIQHGASLVPSVVFGEKEAYNKLEISEEVKSWFLKNLKIPLLVFWGTLFTWIPLRKKIVTIFGAPIPVKQNPNPSDEEVKALHALYVQEFSKLFEEHKKNYSFAKNQRLIIL